MMGLLFLWIEKMNCSDIKDKLYEKDNQILEMKSKTIEYFNLIKDDVVNKLIDDHINDEFKQSFYIVYEFYVLEVLYTKLGIDKKYTNYRYNLSFFGMREELNPDVYFHNHTKSECMNEMERKFIDIKKSFDAVCFRS